ncbi:MAG TPA: insulinase family protein [Candidatus Limnocylindria bacterium]|nr:insulinase family protein [Candidatus Limnocylindria bacterium]
MTYAVFPDPAQPAAAIALWYRAPSSGFEGTPVPGFSRLAAATVAASAPITGTPLGRLVAGFGGRLTVAAYPDSVSVTALVPPDRVAQTLRALTGDYFAPVTTQAGFELAQQDVGQDSLYRSYDPEEAIEDALGSSLFGQGPLHDGVMGSPDGYRAATLDRIKAFAERAFRPSNAILVLSGNVDPAALSAVATREGASQQGAERPIVQQPLRIPSPVSRHGNASGIGLGWVGPPIADESSATALDFISDALFAPDSGSIQKVIGNRRATVSGRFVTFHDPGIFLVTISGQDAAAVRPLVERALADAAKPMAPAAFAAARAGFIYRMLADLETPDQTAETFGWYSVEGNAAYAPAGNLDRSLYFKNVAALTPKSVAATVARYLGVSPAVVTLTEQPPSGGNKGS